MCGTLCSREGDPTGERQIHGDPGREAFPADDSRKTHDCTVLADSSHGDSHVGSVSPAATRTRTLALTPTLTRPHPHPHPGLGGVKLQRTLRT